MKPINSNKVNKETIRIFWQHARPVWFLFSLVVVGIACYTALDLYSPFLYRQLIEVAASSDRSTIRPLLLALCLIVGSKLLGNVFYRIAHFANNQASARVMTELLNTCFTYIHGHSYAFFSNSFAGSLVRKVSRYDDAFDDITSELFWSVIPAAIHLIATIVILGLQSPLLGSGLFVWAILFIGMNYWFVSYKLKFDIARTAAGTAASAHLADTFANSSVIKLFGGFAFETNLHKSLTETLYHARKKDWDLDSVSQGIQVVAMAGLEFGAFYIAIRLWQSGTFNQGDFVFLQVFLLQIFNYLWGVGRYLHKIYEGFGNSIEMTEILTTPHSVADIAGATSLTVENSTIDFNKVHFGYGTQAIFTDFNLRIEAGQRIALVGTSGSGKSTITKLLFRFLDVQKGTISISGHDIATVTQESLREQIALVPQDALLFHRSIEDNIRYGRPNAPHDEVVAAAKAAHCDRFIAYLPQGYGTLVGEQGIKLSGGERQRIAIARAILKNAPILVLDEATSSLDSESEHLIQDALHTLMEERTTIVIAHRLSTIMQMDVIYVLNEGRIIESGSHNELLERENGAYKKLWDIQAGGFV